MANNFHTYSKTRRVVFLFLYQNKTEEQPEVLMNPKRSFSRADYFLKVALLDLLFDIESCLMINFNITNLITIFNNLINTNPK